MHCAAPPILLYIAVTGVLEVVNGSHLHWTFSSAAFDSAAAGGDDARTEQTPPKYSDELWLVKTKHGPGTARPCPAAAAAAGMSGFETCRVGRDGRAIAESCSRELTEQVLAEH